MENENVDEIVKVILDEREKLIRDRDLVEGFESKVPNGPESAIIAENKALIDSYNAKIHVLDNYVTSVSKGPLTLDETVEKEWENTEVSYSMGPVRKNIYYYSICDSNLPWPSDKIAYDTYKTITQIELNYIIGRKLAGLTEEQINEIRKDACKSVCDIISNQSKALNPKTNMTL